MISFFHIPTAVGGATDDPERALDMLGYLPTFLSEVDPRPAREQLHENYQHGGGWHPFTGFKLNESNMSLQYPGDPAYKPIAMTTLHGKEAVYIYQYAWVLIRNIETREWEVARMD